MATAGDRDGQACFEIGLVMSGAVSAGSYTAGVVDFLIQALDQWQEGRRGGDARCPRHRVSLKVMAGASAGGMSAAIAAAQLGEAHTPADKPGGSGPPNNKLYDSWVRRIDISRFLGTADLDADPGGDVASLLDSTVLDEIAAATFSRQDGPPPPGRDYVADPLHVLLTVTTLRGIPYAVRFLGDRDAPPRMSMHGDHLHFALGEAEGLGPEVRPLASGRYDDPQWKAFSLTALATGACPGLFAPRKLTRTRAECAGREWPIPAVVEEGRITRGPEFRKVPPDYDGSIGEGPDFGLEVVAVDGGLNDNMPLKLARRLLEGDRYFSPERRGDRAMIAVAPFPDLPTFTIPQPPPGTPMFLASLAGALAGIINHARFDPKIAIEDRDPDRLNRYVISPSRDFLADARVRSHLAGGAVGGLGDFLAHEFREHDFQLGRRNCQQFLRDVFVQPEDEGSSNPRFDSGWTPEARDHYRFARGPDGRRRPPGSTPAAGDRACLPIIPLWGTAAREVPEMAWPRYYPARLDALRAQVDRRAHAVFRRLIERNVPGRLRRLALRGAEKYARRLLVDKLVRGIARDLGDRGLLG